MNDKQSRIDCKQFLKELPPIDMTQEEFDAELKTTFTGTSIRLSEVDIDEARIATLLVYLSKKHKHKKATLLKEWVKDGLKARANYSDDQKKLDAFMSKIA